LPPLMTVNGLKTLPRLLLIFLPFSSKTIPCVMTVPYGAWAFSPSAVALIFVSRLDWNQPLCWSDPSRYTSASGRPSASGLTPSSLSSVHEHPESNQTSIVSSPLRHSRPSARLRSSSVGSTNSSAGPSHQ